jgi:hypothetical protein
VKKEHVGVPDAPPHFIGFLQCPNDISEAIPHGRMLEQGNQVPVGPSATHSESERQGLEKELNGSMMRRESACFYAGTRMRADAGRERNRASSDKAAQPEGQDRLLMSRASF